MMLCCKGLGLAVSFESRQLCMLLRQEMCWVEVSLGAEKLQLGALELWLLWGFVRRSSSSRILVVVVVVVVVAAAVEAKCATGRLVLWCLFMGRVVEKGGWGGGMLTFRTKIVQLQTAFILSSVLCQCSALPWTPGLRLKEDVSTSLFSCGYLLALCCECADHPQAGWLSDLSRPGYPGGCVLGNAST